MDEWTDEWMDRWMEDVALRPFNSISVISRRWVDYK